MELFENTLYHNYCWFSASQLSHQNRLNTDLQYKRQTLQLVSNKDLYWSHLSFLLFVLCSTKMCNQWRIIVQKLTRMHSSRMRTARSLTISRSIWWGEVLWGPFRLLVECRQVTGEDVLAETGASRQVLKQVWLRKVSDRDNIYLRETDFKWTVTSQELLYLILVVCTL